MSRLGESNLREIILSRWIPAAIVGVMAGLVVPLMQQSISANQVEHERVVELWDRKEALWQSMNRNFSCYLNNWSRKKSFDEAKSGTESQITEIEQARYERFILHRDNCNDALSSDLVLARNYFGEETREEVDHYVAWRGSYSKRTGGDLPSIGEHRQWQYKIARSIRRELLNEEVSR